MITEITLRDVAFKAVESEWNCTGCAFYASKLSDLCNKANEVQKCCAVQRADNKNVIWVRA